MVLDNNGSGFSDLTALKSALVKTGIATGTYVAFGLLTNGKLYQLTVKNTSGAGIDATEAQSATANLVLTLTGITDYTGGDIVLV
jgi:predicted transcriptional regulator